MPAKESPKVVAPKPAPEPVPGIQGTAAKTAG